MTCGNPDLEWVQVSLLPLLPTHPTVARLVMHCAAPALRCSCRSHVDVLQLGQAVLPAMRSRGGGGKDRRRRLSMSLTALAGALSTRALPRPGFCLLALLGSYSRVGQSRARRGSCRAPICTMAC
jgi:hypothetical protein